MRVLIVHNRPRSVNPSGEDRAVDQEAELLASAGHQVVRYERESDEIVRLPLVKKATLPGRVVWSTEDRRRVRALIRRVTPHIIHVHNTFPLISPSVLGAGAEQHVPVVATLHNFRLMCSNALLFRDGAPCELCVGGSALPGVVHGCYRDSKAASVPIALSIEVHRRLNTWTRQVSAFIALSEFARHMFVAAGLPAARIHLKPNFAQPPSHMRVGAGDHILFVGRLSPEKGADLLIRAWSRSLGRLVIIGDGPARASLERQMEPHGDSVRFLGRQSPERCMELLRHARALVVPSRSYEGFPVVVAEAYAHGVPVIGPALGVFPEIVNDGNSGLLFAPGNAESLAATMGEVVEPSTSIRMGQHARRLYEERYTPRQNLDLLLQIYEQARRRRAG
jgi:glycosyltransferase involved in cell wall biosynthesis